MTVKSKTTNYSKRRAKRELTKPWFGSRNAKTAGEQYVSQIPADAWLWVYGRTLSAGLTKERREMAWWLSQPEIRENWGDFLSAKPVRVGRAIVRLVKPEVFSQKYTAEMRDALRLETPVNGVFVE